jgi:hypothetical protein
VAIYGASAIEPHPLTLGVRKVLDEIQTKSVSRHITLNKEWRGPYGSESGPFTEEEKHARLSRIEGAHDTINALTAMIRESKEKAKAIEDDKDKHTASIDSRVESYSTTFRDAEKDGDWIPLGQGEHPETFTRILEVLLQNRQQLALDTMTSWIPANLFLAYINRLGQYQVHPTEFYEFLASCQAFAAYFEYERGGHGVVRKRDGSVWPEINPIKVRVRPVPDQEQLAWQLYRNRAHIHPDGRLELCDVDRELMFNTMCKRGMKVDREYWNQGMAYLDYIGGYYT